MSNYILNCKDRVISCRTTPHAQVQLRKMALQIGPVKKEKKKKARRDGESTEAGHSGSCGASELHSPRAAERANEAIRKKKKKLDLIVRI